MYTNIHKISEILHFHFYTKIFHCKNANIFLSLEYLKLR